MDCNNIVTSMEDHLHIITLGFSPLRTILDDPPVLVLPVVGLWPQRQPHGLGHRLSHAARAEERWDVPRTSGKDVEILWRIMITLVN